MSSFKSVVRRFSLPFATALAVMLVGRACLAVVAFELPQVQVTPNMTGGPTTGVFNVLVRAAPADLPKMVGAFNVGFSVSNLLVKLGPPSIPASNALLSDPGPPGDRYFFNASPNDQTILWAHDVPVDQPLVDGKSLITVPFSVPAGLTGTFPLNFMSSVENELTASTGNVPVNILDSGSITVALAVPAVPGDYSNNGVVDAADYVAWRNSLGAAVTLPNEVSGVTPGSVTAEDYNAWRERFGSTAGTAASASVAGAVPEPATLALLLILTLLPAVSSRRAVRGAV
jgi:hypothetical protein